MTSFPSQIHLSLLDADFPKFMADNSSLLIGYHSQRPYDDPERTIIKKTYFKHMKAIEEENNRQHTLALTQYKQTLSTTSLSPKEQYKALCQEENKRLHQELISIFQTKLNPESLKLKIDEDNYTRKRWVFAHPEEQRNKILQCLDIDLIKWNMGVNQEGANRSPFGSFSEKALAHLGALCRTILKNITPSITEGEFYKNKNNLKLLSRNDRLLLLSNSFSSSFAALQHMVGGSALYKIKNVSCPSEKKDDQRKSVCLLTPEISSLGKGRQKILSVIKEQKENSSFQVHPDLSDQTIRTLDQLTSTFFGEIKWFLNSLSDFLTLQELRLELDFTPEEHLRAKSVENIETPLDIRARDINTLRKYMEDLKNTEEMFKVLSKQLERTE